MPTTFKGKVLKATAERRGRTVSGWLGLFLQLPILAAAVGSGFLIALASPWFFALLIPLAILFFVNLNGFFLLQPNQAEVLVFFGKYNGTVERDGFFMANPLNMKRKISLRVHNFNSDKLKVNDADGNPVEIAAVVVWRVVDTARAMFDVEDYREFVHVQAETAIRTLAGRYPYDRARDDETPTLRGATDDLADELTRGLQARLVVAGIQILEARLTHLAYSAEIAGAMLRRQQAAAVVAARREIVEGAVGMVEDALQGLESKKLVKFNQEQRARLVTNLMVVLTSEEGAQPMVTAGSD